MTDKRPLLRAIFDAAVGAAHPDKMLHRHLPPPPKGRVIILAAGKSAAAMAAAAERYYLDEAGLPEARISGVATTRHGHRVSTRRVEVIEAGHPVPDEQSLRGAEKTLALAAEAGPDDLVLALISGGGSANWIAPVEGVSFAQKQQINKSLLRSGAPISDMNTVRKHLSRIKGGRLARAAYPAQLVTLAISDVPHDDPAVIASGPTVPDPSTLQEARDIVARYKIPAEDSVKAALDDPRNESVKPDDKAFEHAKFAIVAKPRDSLEAAVRVAAEAGYEVIDLGADLEGEARAVAEAHAKIARDARAAGKRIALMSGGELTVIVRGNGRGGPNQEYVLALAASLADMPNVAILAADTDGADGGAGKPDDPAGAMVDEKTFAKIRELKLDATAYLDNNDATTFFEKTGDLLITGPTLTNVNDVRVILVD
ncbi:MAG: glycerate kinase [Xanthobacteraceae bacterium]|nr:glycerate kinase [Xanthobacteraceae bacterium]